MFPYILYLRKKHLNESVNTNQANISMIEFHFHKQGEPYYIQILMQIPINNTEIILDKKSMSLKESSVIIKRRKPQNMMKQMLKNILAIQEQAQSFNFREDNIPKWVHSMNKFKYNDRTIHLKKLTEPKQMYIFLTKNFNPNPQNPINFSRTKKQTNSMVSISPKKLISFRNKSTISRIIKTQVSEKRKQQKKQFEAKLQEIQKNWKQIDHYREKNSLPIRTYRNTKVDKIIQKVNQKRGDTISFGIKSSRSRTFDF